MTYSKGMNSLKRLKGRSELDISMRLDATTLDESVGTYEEVPISTFSFTDGYTVGQNGEQSIDPATGVATYKEFTNSKAPDTFLAQGDYVEDYYDGTVRFGGLVREVTCQVYPSSEAKERGFIYERSATYQLASLELLLLSRLGSWSSLPVETAYERLSRWFTIDTTDVSDLHSNQLNVPVEAQDSPGSKSLLEIARDFSQATGLPLRVSLSQGPDYVQVFDDTVPWLDTPLTALPLLSSSDDWATNIEYTNGVPTGLDVKRNDIRLLDVTFRVPDPANVNGFILPVLKVSHLFSTFYQASIELDPAGGGSALAPGEVTQKNPSGPTNTAPDWGYNVRDFGARGDGVNDDFLSLQACLNTAGKYGAQVMIPAGTYNISQALQVPSNVMVLGQGMYSTTIKQTDKDQDVVRFTYLRPDGGGVAMRGGLKDLQLYGAGGATGTGRGVFAALVEKDGTVATSAPIFGGQFENVMVRYTPSHGWHMGGIFGMRFTQCNAWEIGLGNTTPAHGFFLDGGTLTTGTYQTSTFFQGCYANACSGWGYRAVKQQYTTYNACSTDSCLLGGYSLRDSTAIGYVSCGAESSEISDLDAAYAPNPVPGNDPMTGLPLLGHAAADYVMPIAFQVESTVGGGSTGITYTSCWTYGAQKYGWRFIPDDITTPQNFTVQATMTDCTNLTINKVAADYVSTVRVENNADVGFYNNRFRGAPETNRAKIISIASGANTHILGYNNGFNEPQGLSHDLTSPALYPYKDSIQALNRYQQDPISHAITGGDPTMVPFVAIGMPGQTAPVFASRIAAITGDAATLLEVSPNYTIMRAKPSGSLLIDMQTAGSASVLKVSETDGVQISQAGVALSLPIYATPAAAKAAIPSGSRHGKVILVDSAGTGPSAGLKLCYGIGSNFYYFDAAGTI